VPVGDTVGEIVGDAVAETVGDGVGETVGDTVGDGMGVVAVAAGATGTTCCGGGAGFAGLVRTCGEDVPMDGTCAWCVRVTPAGLPPPMVTATTPPARASAATHAIGTAMRRVQRRRDRACPSWSGRWS